MPDKVVEESLDWDDFREFVRDVVSEAVASAAAGSLLTEEDIRLIKAHVRLPPVAKLAAMEERVRCAALLLDQNMSYAATLVLMDEAEK